MVAIFTGLGAGFARGSANILGGAGQLGSASQGRGGESVSINAATGNLLIAQQDEFLIGRGLDIGVSRTYNSLVDAGDGDNGDQWQQSSYRRIFALIGTANTSGSSVQRQAADGSVVSYGWDVARGLYLSTDGDGAHDSLAYNGSTWTWIDGSSRVSETYSASGANNWRITQAQDRASNGTNTVTYSYIGDKLDKITSADGSWLQYSWSGNNITQVYAQYTNLTNGATVGQTRTRYAYDGLNRLTQVTVDLSPTDNAIGDGKTYVTTYTYHGNSKLIATIGQTDGSQLSMSYDVSGRVTSFTQTVAAGDVRTTSLTYGLNFTSVTGPDGQTTRLDYSGDNLIDTSMLNWFVVGATKEVAGSLSGETAVKVTSPAGVDFSTIYNSLSATAGDTFKFEVSFQAVPGGSTEHALALHGNSSQFGVGYSSARILSGPGQVVMRSDGVWRVIGLSSTQTTRVEIVRTFTQTEGGGVYLYIDEPNGFRDGQQLLIAGPHLSKLSSNQSTRKQLTKITAPPATAGAAAAQTINYAYDSSGNLLSVTDSLGKITSFTYDGNGNQLTATDPNGNLVTRTYDANNNKLTETTTGSSASAAAVALTTRYAYDGDNQLRFVVTAEGQVTEYYYDGYGQMYYSAEFPQASYNVSGLAANQSIGQGALDAWKQSFDNTYSQTSESWYDGRGNITRTVAYGRSGYYWATRNVSEGYSESFFTYDHAGRLLSRNNQNEVAETFVYDGLNRLIGSTDLAGGTTSIVFNDAATQTVVTLGNGQVTTSTYNKAGDLISATQASDWSPTANSTFKYDKNGRLRMSTDGDGGNSYYLYDKAGRKTADINHYGWTTEYRYDAANRVVAQVKYLNAISSGYLTTLADPNNTLDIASIRPGAYPAYDKWTWSVYDNSGRVIQSINGAGEVTAFEYDNSNRLIKTTGYVAKLSQAVIDGFKVTAPASAVAISANAAQDRVTRSFYDRDGNLIGVLNAEGYLTESVYDKAGQLVEEIGYAQQTNSGYWASGTFDQLRSTANPGSAANRRMRSVYDGQGLKRYTVNAQGLATRFDYNAAGRLTQTVSFSAAISTADFSYDNVKALVNAIANGANDRASTVSYNGRGQAASTTDAIGLTTYFTYDVMGNVIKTVAGDRVTRNWYTQKGELRFSVDAEGFVTEQGFDADSQTSYVIRYATAQSFGDGTSIGSVSAAVGGDFAAGRYERINYSYYANGGLYSQTDALGAQTITAYYPNGVELDVYHAYGTADHVFNPQRFDGAGRLQYKYEGYGDAEVAITEYRYDGLGNLTAVVDPRGAATSYTYDKLGRVTSTTDAHGGQTLYQYDAFGNQTAVRDARGFWTYNYYDNLGRLIQTTDASGVATISTFNIFGELASVSRAGATTSFQYDKMGRVTRSTDALGFFETYAYNVYGDRTSKTAKSATGSVATGGTTTYTFDRRGLLLSETLPQGSYDSAGTLISGTVTNKFEYDAYGNRTKLIEAFGLSEARTTQYVYDKNNRLIQTIGQTFLGQTPNEYVYYDARGNVTGTVNAAGGRSVFYYDDLNRKTVEINPVGTYTKYTYDKSGNVTDIRVYENPVGVPADGGSEEEAPGVPGGNFRQTTFTYDNVNRLLTSSIHGATSGRASGASWVADGSAITTTYEYDANGNVVRLSDAYGNATYSYYDALGRKTHQVDQENYLTVWSYNADGNVTWDQRYANKVVGTPIIGSPPGVAASSEDRHTSFTYDLVGNRTSETRHNVLVHNGAGANNWGAAIIYYSYNGLGQVVRKTEATGDFVDYGYDAAGRLTVESRKAYVDFSGVWVTPTVDYYYNGVNDLSRTRQRGSGDSAERVTTYGYDGGKLRWVTDAEGGVRYYWYDQGGRQTYDYYTRYKSDGSADSSYNGNLTSYDVMGRVISKWQADYSTGNWTTKGPVTQLTYNAFGDVVGTSVGGILQQQNQYDLAGRLTGTTSGDGIWKYFGYDKNGNQTAAITSAGSGLGGSLAAALSLVGGEGVNGSYTVYDKRNMATTVFEEGRRFSASGVLQTLTTSRAYNAFGDVASETDAAGATINYSYNTMGRMIRSESPGVEIVGENGVALTVRPAEDYYYDASGRLVATRDANGSYSGVTKNANTGNLTILTLLTGTGYGGSQAQVTAETHADGGVKQTRYDIHGDARVMIDEIGRQSTRSYDRLGRMVQSANGAGLVDYYSYDILGQQIKHWNNYLGVYDVETTDYDIQGRIISQRSFGGDVTTISYSWEALTTPGLGTFGGWLQTTYMANGLYSQERTDLFGRITWKRDLGGYTTDYSYDVAGRMASSSSNGMLVSFGWFNSGYQASVTTGSPNAGQYNTNWTRDVTTYSYSVTGNRLTEYMVRETGVYTPEQWIWYNPYEPEWIPESYDVYSQAIKNQTASYDALGRMKTWAEAGTGNAPASSISTSYDAGGNVRRTYANYYMLDVNGYASTPTTRDYWFRYDSMNRVVTNQGVLENGAIVRGAGGYGITAGQDILYDAAGQRTAVITSQYYFSGYVGYNADTRENYYYDAAGRLSSTYVAADATSQGTIRSSLSYDLMGRMVSQTDYEAGVSIFNRTAYYNNKGQLYYDVAWTKKTDNKTYQSTNSYYFTDYNTGQYMLGSVAWMQSTSTINGGSYTTSRTVNSYVWRDSAVQSSIQYKPNINQSTTYNTTFYLNSFGQLTGAYIADGKPRSVSYTLDELGQIIRRDETRPGNAPSGQTGSPHEVWYRFGGRQLGYTGNNGTADLSFDASIAERRIVSPTNAGTYRNGQLYGSSYADFAQNYDPINSYFQGAAGGSYRVQQGDTLSSIAQSLYGDSSLWYKIGEANGLSASAGLIDGQTLVLPTGVIKSKNNAGTFQPYNASEAIGDLSPTQAKPPKKPKCGVFGQILLAVVAIAVTYFTAGTLTGALGPVLGGAAAGAAGSVASQVVGLATGIQDKFSFKGVALAALGGAVGGGLKELGRLGDLGKLGAFSKVGSFIGGTGFASTVTRAALSSAVTQGIGVATGLQDKFSWAGVAASAVGAAAGYGAGKLLGATQIGPNSNDIGNYAANLGKSAASLIANAATRSLIEGTDFGDNILAGLPDVIAQTIGDILINGINLGENVNPALQTESAQAAGTPAPAPTPANDVRSTLTPAEREARLRAAIPDALAAAAAAETNTALDADERADLAAAGAQLRRRDTEYKYESVPNQPTAAGGAKIERGRGIITIVPSSDSYFNLDGTVNVNMLAATLVHEGRHLHDQRAERRTTGTRTVEQSRQTERNAYRTEAAFLKSVNVIVRYTDPSGTVRVLDKANANYIAELSVQSWTAAAATSARQANADAVRRNDANYATYLRRVAARNASLTPAQRAAGYVQTPSPKPAPPQLPVPVYSPPTSY